MTINDTKLTASAILAIALGQVVTAATPAKSGNELCAAVLIAEAGGEGRIGMQAGWEVIHRRSINRRISHAAVVKQQWQFSCLNRTSSSSLIRKAKRHRRWSEAVAIAAAKPRTSYTKQADHYHAASMSKRPYWIKGQKPTACVGGHLFYKLND